MPRAVTDGVTTWAGLASPIRIGPTATELVTALTRLKAMLAASRLGKINRLASPVKRRVRKDAGADRGRQRGVGMHLAVDLEVRRPRHGSAPGLLRILRALSVSRLPKLECDSSATLGAMPKRRTASAASRVISAIPSAGRSTFT